MGYNDRTKLDQNDSICCDVLQVAMPAEMERTRSEQVQNVVSLDTLSRLHMPTSEIVVAHPWESCDTAV